MKELKIGHKYNSCGLVYEVREAECCCRGCSFMIEEENECTDRKGRMGHCSRHLRKDHTDVIFVQVGEGEPDPQGRVIEVDND